MEMINTMMRMNELMMMKDIKMEERWRKEKR
jgi:hypothetical protein